MAYTNLKNLFTEIADAIRSKTGVSADKIQAKELPNKIASIPVVNSANTTASPVDIRTGKTAVIQGRLVNGTGGTNFPSSVSVSNGTDVSYNSNTGVISFVHGVSKFTIYLY